MMKSKEALYRLFIMLAMAVLLVMATLAWFVNNTNAEASGLIFGSSDLKVTASLREVIIAEDGGVTYGEVSLFDEAGNAKIEIGGIVPGQKKVYEITVSNQGETANVGLGVHDIELGKYTELVGESPVERVSILDEKIFFSLAETPDVPTVLPDKTIFIQRNGSAEIAGIEKKMETGATGIFHAVFLYDSAAQTFEDGTLTLQFGISATLR